MMDEATHARMVARRRAEIAEERTRRSRSLSQIAEQLTVRPFAEHRAAIVDLDALQEQA